MRKSNLISEKRCPMKKILEEVRGAKSVAISGHIRPDGDCVGSCMGLYLYLTKENSLIKKIKFENPEAIEQAMFYIGNDVQFFDKNKSEFEINNNKTILDKFAISFLSLVYNAGFYAISYVFLILFFPVLFQFLFHHFLFLSIQNYLFFLLFCFLYFL